jgi:hypothetical protein
MRVSRVACGVTSTDTQTYPGTAGKNASNSDTLTNGAVGNLDALPTPGPPKRPRGRPAKKQGETKSPKRIAGRINPSRAVKVLCNATPSTKKLRTPTQDKPGANKESTHAAAMGTILDEAATPRSNTQKWPPPISESQHQDNIFGQAANISRSRRDQQTCESVAMTHCRTPANPGALEQMATSEPMLLWSRRLKKMRI